MPFLDSNILLRHLLADHPDHSPRATAYLERVERGEVQVQVSDTVIFEAVFTLQRSYGQPRLEIRNAVLPLLELPAVDLPGKRRYRRVFDLYVDENIPFADAFHAVLAEEQAAGEVLSFDTHFDRIQGIRRIEP